MKFHKDNMLKLSIKPGEKWFVQIPDLSSGKTANPDIVTSLKAEAQNLLDSETKLYHKFKESQKDKDFLWIKKILQAGTLSDKVSAHTLLVQDLTVYNLSSVETLIGMVNTKGKRECLMAMDTLQHLFTGELLIEGRKLTPFNERPLEKLDEICQGSSALRKQHLILWQFEDQLKLLYKKFLTSLEAVSHDSIEKTKIKAISVMARLLQDNGEEEQFLLEKLVNKMGDPIPKVGSHLCHQLGSVLSQHDQMKTIVVQEVERLVFRPNLSERAKYYALCFLNQIILTHEEFKLANHLITIYFSQFKLFVRKGEVDTKMMSALLTGVARAYPYAKLKDNVISTQLDAMYRLVHMVSFNISVQALMLIFQVLDSNDSLSDRFYGVLYRKLLDPALGSSSRQALFLSLVYRALKKDVAVVRVKAFVKRMLQVSLYQAPNLQCGILVLISELNKVHPNLLEVKPTYQSDSESEEHYEDAPEESDTVPETKVKVEPAVKLQKKSVYDIDCRNPLHTKASAEGLWELLFLKQSFHPSVCLFAHQISNRTEIKYSGDPLLDFTTSHFLDRFVYRNPKKTSENFRSDPKSRVFGKRKLKERMSQKVPVMSQEYLHIKENNIPIEEQFLYKYLHRRAANISKQEDDSDIESVCSDDFEQLLDNIHPEDEGKDSLNFAKELGLHKQKKAAKRKGASDSEEGDSDGNLSDMAAESDFEDDLDLDDEEIDEAFKDLGDEMDVCDEDFIGEDEDTRPRKKSKKNKGLSDENLLADADEFSTLLEEGAGGDLDTLTSEAFKTTDKTSAKQLHWEMERDRFIKGKRKPKFWKKKSKKQRKA